MLYTIILLGVRLQISMCWLLIITLDSGQTEAFQMDQGAEMSLIRKSLWLENLSSTA
jgi:hypothetical protein